ncbi:LacI family DNA-binding transcriptional regulator [Streptomyces canus]|uniref:LacI family DNA-binding transcriptional regulator n=1 Tax=Streptomyces canus TaxID=58343 RepID=UPI002E268ACA
MGRDVTMRAVAERAGVSTKTVSNVVNGTGAFSPETERRVRAAIDELGYRINLFARGLRSRRTDTIALSLPNLYQPFYAELAEQLIRAPEAQGLKVVLETTRGDAGRERAVLTGSRRELVDGVIYLPGALPPGDCMALPIAQPTVVVGEQPEEAAARGVDCVSIPNEDGAHAAVAHLLGQGRRRIAAIGERADGPAGAQRLRGYRRALEEAGVPFDPSLVIAVDNPDQWASGVGAATRLLRTRARFDALFCCTDVMAIGALSALERSGVAVPDDIALAGFDDIEAAQYASPSLTTVDPHAGALARTALSLLRARLGEDRSRTAPGQQASAGFTLRIRKSSTTSPPTH